MEKKKQDLEILFLKIMSSCSNLNGSQMRFLIFQCFFVALFSKKKNKVILFKASTSIVMHIRKLQ